MERLEPFNVIYQTAEDGLGDTVKPRLMEADADLESVPVSYTHLSKVIDGIKKALQSIPKTLKATTKGVNKKQLALKCAPYVIFGYVLNKVSWLYGQPVSYTHLARLFQGAGNLLLSQTASYRVSAPSSCAKGSKDRRDFS